MMPGYSAVLTSKHQKLFLILLYTHSFSVLQERWGIRQVWHPPSFCYVSSQFLNRMAEVDAGDKQRDIPGFFAAELLAAGPRRLAVEGGGRRAGIGT